MNAFSNDVEPWFATGLHVRESCVHGVGLFSHYDIPAASVIIKVGGRFFGKKERYSDRVVKSTTMFVSDSIFIATPTGEAKDISDYINHSCDPNIGLKDAITVVTIRDILAGDELCIDYSFLEGDICWQMKAECACGARSCRKFVTGEDWKRISVYSALFPFYSPFIKRKIRDIISKQQCNEK